MDLGELMHAEAARPLMAPPSIKTTSIAGRDGFEVSSVRLDSFDVDVECHVAPGWPLDMAEGIRKTGEVKRAVAARLYRKGKRPLIFDDDPSLHCMAIVTGVSEVRRVGYVDYFTVTFRCDPVFMANEETERSLGAGENRVDVKGTAPTSPLFEIKASSTSVTVSNGSGAFVKVGCSKGSVVRVDMAAKRATVNGADARVAITSTFFDVGPGEERLTIDGGSGKVTYREAWL